MLTSVLITMVAGAVAGCLGALLGIGGGVFLVPFLNLVVGLPFASAGGISLITIVATSSVTSSLKGRLQVANLRLGMVLEIFTTTGALVGIEIVDYLSERTLQLVFAWTMLLIVAVMATRLGRRNVILDPSIDVGVLGGRFHEDESGGEVAYQVKRVPVAFGASFMAGIVSRMGIGGGVLKVPALNAWCGVPMRAASATSALMLGATAMVGSIDAFARGQIVPEIAAGAVLGVLAGSRIGFLLAGRTKAKSHKVLMVIVLLIVAVIYFVEYFTHFTRHPA